jgi:hypothetical protein
VDAEQAQEEPEQVGDQGRLLVGVVAHRALAIDAPQIPAIAASPSAPGLPSSAVPGQRRRGGRGSGVSGPWLARRLAGTALLLLAMSFVTYGLIGLMPGDPLDLMVQADPNVTSADVARLKA